MQNKRILLGLFIVTSIVKAQAGEDEILLQDNFSNQKIGMSSVFLKAHTEYHYSPEAGPKGLWQVSTAEGDTGSQRAWWIFQEESRNLMVQTYDNSDVHTHPIVIVGIGGVGPL